MKTKPSSTFYLLIGLFISLLAIGTVTVFGNSSQSNVSRFVTSDPNVNGGKIILHVNLDQSIPANLNQQSWAVVQWKTADGRWLDVQGWQGSFHPSTTQNALYSEWWVGRDILGKGPFRWVIFSDSSRKEWLTTTQTFNLPAQNHEILTIYPKFSAPKPTVIATSRSQAQALPAATKAATNVPTIMPEPTLTATVLPTVEPTQVSTTTLVLEPTVVAAADVTDTAQADETNADDATDEDSNLAASEADDLTFFVSPFGDNSDGLSWETAWSELDQIGWDVINPGATIFLDGGASIDTPAVYKTALIPQKSGKGNNPILIQLSDESGHDAQAIFYGGNSIPLPECGAASWDSSEHDSAGESAIKLENGVSNIIIDGRKRGGIQIHGWAKHGIEFDPDRSDNGEDDNTKNITLQYMEIYNNGGIEIKDDGDSEGLYYPYHAGSGIRLSGIGHIFRYLEIHDNAADAIQSSFTDPSSGVFNNMDKFTLTNSWLYNQRAHSGIDNSPAGEICTLDNQEGCDELGAPQMSADYLNYPDFPKDRRESFNWCTHNDGIQIYSANDLNKMTIKRSIIGPNLMNALLLGDRTSDTTTAWVNNLNIQDVVVTRFSHTALGMKSPPAQAGQNWDINNITIYGHFSNTLKGTLNLNSTATETEHSIRNSTMMFGQTEFPNGNIQFENNCEFSLYSGSIGGIFEDPEFAYTAEADVFENDLSVDFATVFRDDYTPQNSKCLTSASRTTSVDVLLSTFDSQ